VDTKSLAYSAHRKPEHRAARTAKAKSSGCAGCSKSFPHRDLLELTEDNHDNLTYLHGDQLCEGCAAQHGVL
jgi:hypothetical protein